MGIHGGVSEQMSRSYWVAIVAVIGLVFAGPVEGRTVGHGERCSLTATELAKDPNNGKLPTMRMSVEHDIQSIAGSLQTISQKPASPYEKRNAEAQERVAWWTPWFWGIAVLEALVTLAGVVLVYRTLKYTGRTAAYQKIATRAALAAARDSKRAADAAEKAIKVNRDIGRAQVRAYLGLDVVSGDVAIGKPIKFQVRITNHGQSPASEIAIASCVVVRSPNWGWDDNEKMPGGQIPCVTLHPNGFFDVFPDVFPPVVLTDQMTAALRGNQSCVFCRVIVVFKDVFKSNWEARFSFEFSGDDCFGSGKPRISSRGNCVKRINDGATTGHT